ncbi:unnamed protein product [Clavelina lepadiformis]|uniref:Uncharacterized protein n=1 Tax=Clavelina lepadiformis TaxID=159417 RepID=A0ABP0H173_CLALP
MDSNKHFETSQNFLQCELHIWHHIVHKALFRTYITNRPVRTFCNVNCTFGTILFTRPVRTFCNVNCTFGTILFTRDPLELFAM